jgi:ribosomal protein S5
MIKVNCTRARFPHEAEAKVGGARILIKPASAGTGLIAGGVVRTILEVAGVSNALSKSLGSTNKANTAYATIAALQRSFLPRQVGYMLQPKTGCKKTEKAKKGEEKNMKFNELKHYQQ